MKDEIEALCEEITQLNLENTRLKAEVERLRAEVDYEQKSHRAYARLCEETENRLAAAIERLIRERDEARAEVERQRQEPDLLRAELIAIHNASRVALSQAYDRACETSVAMAQELSAKALENKL